MELNSLPEDCLLLLLELFPVNVQAHLRAVCTQWKQLIERIWRKVRKIDIRYRCQIGHPRITFDSNPDVSCKVLGSGLKRFVMEKYFPCVTSFKLSFGYNNSDEQSSSKELLSHCLAQWTVRLKDLWLTIGSLEQSQEFQSATWTQIDSMKSLKFLYLNLPRFSTGEDGQGGAWKMPENFSILANLEHLTLYDSKNGEIGALTQLGPNLTQLTLELKPESTQSFKTIAPRLTSLQDLEIAIDKFAQPYLLDLLISLAQLDQLNSLKLRSIDWGQFISFVTTPNDYPELSSIEHLEMNITNSEEQEDNPRHHMDQFNKHFFTCFPFIFPSLDTIEVMMWGQTDQQFIDMIEDRMERKFVALVERHFDIIPYTG